MAKQCASIAGAFHSALGTLEQQWARISRVVVAAVVPAAVLFLGHGYSSAHSIWHSAAFVTFMQWFVVTSVVVALPTVGKTTQKAVERMMGSLFGGALGLIFVAAEAPWAKVLGVILATSLGEFVSIHFKKDYTGRLMGMTYLIVVTPTWEGSPHPWLGAVLRMTSVLAGIAWTFLVSLLWFPETSSHTVYKHLLVMMNHLEHLGSDTWALIEQQQRLLVMQQQQHAKQQQPHQQPHQQHDVLADHLPVTANGGAGCGLHCSNGSTATHAAASSFPLEASAAGTGLGFKGSAAGSAPGSKGEAAGVELGFKGSAAGAAPGLKGSEALPQASNDVCIHMPDTAEPISALQMTPKEKFTLEPSSTKTSQQPQQPLSLQEFLEGDACDADVREFMAARALLQDALKAAAAERHIGWLFGRPIILPSVLLPCSASARSSGCCLSFRPRAKASRASADNSHSTSCIPSTVQETVNGVQDGAGGVHSVSASHGSQQGDVCGLPAFLASQQVRMVAIAQRHCSHVLWMLHKLLQDGFDEQALLAVHRKYPEDMLVSIQHDAQAVLQAATSLLQSAIQHHHHWHLRKDSSGAVLLKQQLGELRANMDSLHGRLQHWQEIFLNISHMRREAVMQMLQDHSLCKPTDGVSVATAAPTTPAAHQRSHPAGAGAPAPRAPGCGSESAAAAAAPQSVTMSAAVPGMIDVQTLVQHNGEGTEHQDGIALMRQLPGLFFITPRGRESYLFVLKWHALHYILQQLDSTFTQLTSTLQELLAAMHGLHAVSA